MTPKLRAILAIAALFLIAIFANWLVRLLPLGNRTLDLTGDQRHTLSDGTKSILRDLDAPVTIRYYASRGSENMPREAKLYMKKVDALLRDYANLAPKGHLRIENFDPQPDTDAEDSAVLDGIAGQRYQDGDYEENIFLGLSISCLDQKTNLPYLDPRNETQLEYNLSRAIAEVSRSSKPKIGIISPLSLAGNDSNPMMQMQGQTPQPAWLIYSLLEQDYEIINLGMTPEAINREEIATLLILHPAGITPATEYLIDQYLLSGGNIVATLDPHCLSAPPAGGNPMMGMTGGNSESSLPTLLPAWGIDYKSEEFVADLAYASPLQDNTLDPSYLNLPSAAIVTEGEIATANLTNLFYVVSGCFKNNSSPYDYTPIIQSSKDSGLLPSMNLRMPGNQNPFRTLQTDDKRYDLTARLQGKFKTAFPNGKPKIKDQEAPETPTDETATAHLSEAKETGTIILFADTDFLNDQACYQQQNLMGQIILQPITDNPSLFFNLIDQLSGSQHLIGARSRTATRRPFTVIKEMEAEHQKEVGTQIQELETRQEQSILRLQELQAQRSDSSALVLNDEQEAEIQRLQEEQVTASQQIRDKQKTLKKKKDALASNIIKLNLGIVPAASSPPPSSSSASSSTSPAKP